ncbi:hypothetical protein WMY93_033455 [Mugilogobius chulae]|uniref:CARD domain-containing protein n=1 Tax=Mugilogobius chulae TaxID=88201 RepID=A0AAW0MI31_9GOBI
MSKEAELQYRIIQWDEALLESSSELLQDLCMTSECPEQALFELHLPTVNQNMWTCLRAGSLWPTSPTNPKTKRRKLNVLLLPINVSVDEVGHKQPNMRNVQVPANCNFTVKQKYSLECSKAFKVQPNVTFKVQPKVSQSYSLECSKAFKVQPKVSQSYSLECSKAFKVQPKAFEVQPKVSQSYSLECSKAFKVQPKVSHSYSLECSKAFKVQPKVSQSYSLECSKAFKVQPKVSYSLECSKAFKVQPKEAEFFLNYGPNYHPTFEVRLTAENELINITIRTKTRLKCGCTRWIYVIAEELRQSSQTLPSSRSLLLESDETLKRWLSSVRPDFIQRVLEPVLNQVLDRLLACGVLTMAESESLRSRGRWDRAVDLIDSVVKKGAKASRLFVSFLSEEDKCLFEDLQLKTTKP